MCTAQDVVQCVHSHHFPCPVFMVLVSGALRGLSRSEGQTPPDPKGWTCAAAAPDTPADLLGARAERVPDCSSYLSRIPGVQQTVGRQSTRATPVARAAAGPFQPPRARLHALLNASAAGESTVAGGLEAFSQGIADAERFENASSKFRWNPSPLLPFT